MKLNGKPLSLAMLALLFVTGGCGGINTTQSVSPATFFLPGLLKADPVAPALEVAPQLAQVR